MLLLTSYDRMRRYLSNLTGTALTDSKAQKQLIMGWIMAASKQVETYLNRNLAFTAYTEYFDTSKDAHREFFVGGYPVVTLTDVYEDADGEFDGDESEVTDCIIGKNNDSIVLPTAPSSRGYKAYRARYVGGMAYHGTRSIFAISGSSGSWAAGQYVLGGTSEAVGIAKVVSSTSMTVEVLYGIFQAGESLAGYTDEDLTTSASTSATLSSITYQSLVESYPDIVRACEMQVRYYWKHKDDFEQTSSQRDATNQRRGEYNVNSVLTPEAKALLDPYRRGLCL